MKVSKLSFKKASKVKSPTGKVNATKDAFKHEFRVIPAEEVNENRSKAYQFLAF